MAGGDEDDDDLSLVSDGEGQPSAKPSSKAGPPSGSRTAQTLRPGAQLKKPSKVPAAAGAKASGSGSGKSNTPATSSTKQGQSTSAPSSSNSGRGKEKEARNGKLLSSHQLFEPVDEEGEVDYVEDENVRPQGRFQRADSTYDYDYYDYGDEDYEEDEYGYGYDGEYRYDEYYDEEEEQQPAAKSGSKGKGYVSRGLNRRRRNQVGPSSWGDVDDQELQEEADSLVQTVNRFNQGSKESKLLQEVFDIQAAQEDSVSDPLGLVDVDVDALAPAEKGTTRRRRKQPKPTVNKWHKRKGEPDAAEALSPSKDGTDTPTKPVGLDEDGVQVLPNMEGFNPEAYLARFHQEASREALRRGMRTIKRETQERTSQLKTLIKDSFERFISCKSTIDDIHVRLQRSEADKRGASTEQLLKAIEQVNANAQRTFGALLERSQKADRIRSVSNLLKRFGNLFGMPARIKALAESGEYESVVREFNRANTLIRPTSSSARVWVSLYNEIEKHVLEVQQTVKSQLEQPSISPDVAPACILFLALLGQEQQQLAQPPQSQSGVAASSSGAVGQAAAELPRANKATALAEGQVDGMRLYLSTMEQHLAAVLESADEQHESRILQVRDMYSRDPRRPTRIGSTAALASLSFLSAGGSSTSAGGASGVDPDTAFLVWSPSRAEHDPEGAGLLPALPSHLARVLRPGAEGIQGLQNSRLLGGHGRLTPGQHAWLAYVYSMTCTVADALPRVYATCGSSKYAQATELSGSAKESLDRAPVLARRMVEPQLQQLADRVKRAAAMLRKAGPLMPGLELVVLELSHTWLALKAAGASTRSLEPIRASLMDALVQALAALASHMEALPARLAAGQEHWRPALLAGGTAAGAGQQAEQPGSCMPGRMEEEVGIAMQHYRWLQGHAEALQQDVPAEASWQPLHAAFFGAFAAYFSWLQELGEQLKRQGEEAKAEAEAAAKLSAVSLQRIDSMASISPDHRGGSATPASGSHSPNLPASRSAASLSTTADLAGEPHTSSANGPGASRGQVGPGGRRQRWRSALVGDGAQAASVDVRLLTALSDASYLRARLLPALVERYRTQLEGPAGEGAASCRSQLRARQSEVKKAISALLSLYLERQEQRVSKAVEAYVRPDLLSSMAGPSPISSSSSASLLLSVSEGASSLLTLLAEVYGQVASHTRGSSVKAIMVAVLEHCVEELAFRCQELPSDTGVECLLQLHMDLAYLDQAISPALPSSSRADMDAAYDTLAQRMFKMQQRKRYKPTTEATRVLAAVDNVQELSTKAKALCEESVRFWAQRSAANARCFAGF